MTPPSECSRSGRIEGHGEKWGRRRLTVIIMILWLNVRKIAATNLLSRLDTPICSAALKHYILFADKSCGTQSQLTSSELLSRSSASPFSLARCKHFPPFLSAPLHHETSLFPTITRDAERYNSTQTLELTLAKHYCWKPRYRSFPRLFTQEDLSSITISYSLDQNINLPNYGWWNLSLSRYGLRLWRNTFNSTQEDNLEVLFFICF